MLLFWSVFDRCNQVAFWDRVWSLEVKMSDLVDLRGRPNFRSGLGLGSLLARTHVTGMKIAFFRQSPGICELFWGKCWRKWKMVVFANRDTVAIFLAIFEKWPKMLFFAPGHVIGNVSTWCDFRVGQSWHFWTQFQKYGIVRRFEKCQKWVSGPDRQ